MRPFLAVEVLLPLHVTPCLAREECNLLYQGSLSGNLRLLTRLPAGNALHKPCSLSSLFKHQLVITSDQLSTPASEPLLSSRHGMA